MMQLILAPAYINNMLEHAYNHTNPAAGYAGEGYSTQTKKTLLIYLIPVLNTVWAIRCHRSNSREGVSSLHLTNVCPLTSTVQVE